MTISSTLPVTLDMAVTLERIAPQCTPDMGVGCVGENCRGGGQNKLQMSGFFVLADKCGI